METITLGSLFDGSGGFPLAGVLCGIEPMWASEVEPYPIAVTRSRFPKMIHLGDVSKINGAAIMPVHIVTFGSPCQDLSVAGKRAGLKHEAYGDDETTRSGLFMDAVRTIKEMREATNGIYPRFVLWENVPGAFSSNNGEDFRTVCEELIKIVEPNAVMPAVPKGGWAYADSYIGDGWSLAYRVFDAQYWGVPQRRRRIHLVLDLRGQCAREILFEREGVRRYFAEGRTPWKGSAADAQGCAGADDRTGGEMPVICLQGNGIDRADTAGCNGAGWREGQSYTLNTIDRPAVVYALDRASFNQGQNARYDFEISDSGINSTIVAKGPSAVSYGINGEVAGTLDASYYKGCGMRQGCEREVVAELPHHIVRRLTPTECARLQGFPDRWGDIDKKESFTDDEYRFWLDVRNTHSDINGKAVKEYTKEQMLSWYNKLHTDSAEYKMWGNGIALPPAIYCLQGMVDALRKEDGENGNNKNHNA